jgi:hypothetical protein
MKFNVPVLVLLMGAACAVHADTRVHTPRAVQTTVLSEDFDVLPGKVAIDGDFAIVISNIAGGRVAHLYRRGADGRWTATQTLLAAQTSTAPQNDDVVMANGIAALRIGEVLHVFERSGSAYVESETAGTPLSAPGLSISGRRILAARRGCNYSADIHEKSTSSGVWRITGRITGPVGECNHHGAPLDLDGDVALLRVSPTEIREYRRNGTEVQWVHVSSITPPAGASFTLGAPTLSGNIAFVSEGRYFQREAAGWVFRGLVEPLDSAKGTDPYDADYRGPLLITSSIPDAFRAEGRGDLYLRNAAGGFDHVAALQTSDTPAYIDVSGNRSVVSGIGMFGGTSVSFFELPVPLVAPPAIANDFDVHDASGWQQESGSQFALATTSKGVVYRQSSLVGKSTAFLTGSDWANAQSIEADITPTAVDGSDRWVGLVVRYIDANNHYYVTLRASNRLLLQRMVGGVFTTLDETTVPFVLGRSYHIKLIANGPQLTVWVDGGFAASAFDNTLTRGRAGLQTYKARADYDNVYAGSTAGFSLASDDFGDFNDDGRPFTTIGGNWTLVDQPGNPDVAFGQTDSSGDARAFVGAPTGDQVVEAMARVDSFPSTTAGWFGLLARWVDSRTFYYLAVRSNGRLDIRKRVNGTITVLRTVPFSVTPGQYYRLKLAVLGNQLHAYVDDVFIAGAVDGSISRGRYGLATSRAAATYQNFYVDQP